MHLIIECLVWLLGRSDNQRWDHIPTKSDHRWNDEDVGVFPLSKTTVMKTPVNTYHGVLPYDGSGIWVEALIA